MATLRTAPTPKQFANAWTRGFAQAIRDAGGRDGRISLNEAKKIGNRTDGLEMYADNVLNYLDRTGQKSVSIEKLISAGHNYAFAVADNVAGAGNRVSLIEARNLPTDIQGDFLALRGKNDPAIGKLSSSDLVSALQLAAIRRDGDAVTYMSESDYDAVAVSAANPTGRIDGATVLRRFNTHLTTDIFSGVANFDSNFTADVFTGAQSKRFMNGLSETYDGMDDYSATNAAAFGHMITLLESNLSDIHVVKWAQRGQTETSNRTPGSTTTLCSAKLTTGSSRVCLSVQSKPDSKGAGVQPRERADALI